MASQPPTQPPNPASEEAAGRAQPPALSPLFLETFLILGRYFVIVYPVFFYFILQSLLVPRTQPDFNHWPWWVVTIGLVAILFIFKAGWHVMMYQATQEWLGMRAKLASAQNAPEELMPTIPFSILKAFIPGMGEYGLAFLMGGILWLLFTGLPVGLVVALGLYFIGIPQSLLALFSRPDVTPQDIQSWYETISALERSQLQNWNLIILATLVTLLIINGLTLFWQQFLILKQCNPVKAFFYSIRHALRHPVQTLIILVYFTAFYAAFALMVNLSDLFAFLGIFLLILTMVYFGLLLFLYLARVDAPSET